MDTGIPVVICVKVKNIRPKYDNLKEWMKDKDNLYIGRKGCVFIDKQRFPPTDSIWCNNHSIKEIKKEGFTEHEARDEAIRRYKKDLLNNKELMNRLGELKGKTLGCWCKTNDNDVPCHGDVLVELYKNNNCQNKI